VIECVSLAFLLTKRIRSGFWKSCRMIRSNGVRLLSSLLNRDACKSVCDLSLTLLNPSILFAAYLFSLVNFRSMKECSIGHRILDSGLFPELLEEVLVIHPFHFLNKYYHLKIYPANFTDAVRQGHGVNLNNRVLPSSSIRGSGINFKTQMH